MKIVLRIVSVVIYVAMAMCVDESKLCRKTSNCGCTRTFDSKVIKFGFSSIYTTKFGNDTWTLSPCAQLHDCKSTNKPAICKNYKDNIGDLMNYDFIDTGYEISMKFTSDPDAQCLHGRVTYVRLVCNRTEEGKLYFVSETPQCITKFDLLIRDACIPIILTTTSVPSSTTRAASTLIPTSESLTTSHIQSPTSSHSPTTSIEQKSIASSTTEPISSSISPSYTTPTQEQISTILSSPPSMGTSDSQSHTATQTLPPWTPTLPHSPVPSLTEPNKYLDYKWIIIGVLAGTLLGCLVGFFIKRHPKPRSDTIKLAEDFNLNEI